MTLTHPAGINTKTRVIENKIGEEGQQLNLSSESAQRLGKL